MKEFDFRPLVSRYCARTCVDFGLPLGGRLLFERVRVECGVEWNPRGEGIGLLERLAAVNAPWQHNWASIQILALALFRFEGAAR